jgi:hypothetical protein
MVEGLGDGGKKYDLRSVPLFTLARGGYRGQRGHRPFPKINDHHKRMAERPAVKKVLAGGGPETLTRQGSGERPLACHGVLPARLHTAELVTVKLSRAAPRERILRLHRGRGGCGGLCPRSLTASGRHSVLCSGGRRGRNPWIHIPLGYGKHFTNPAVNWLYSSEPQPGAANRRIGQPRGKVIGGSHFVNGLSTYADSTGLRPVARSRQCRVGLEDVLPYFAKPRISSAAPTGITARAGRFRCRTAGPRWRTLPGGREECGYRRNPVSTARPRKASAQPVDDTQGPAERGDRLLRPARRRRLRVSARAHATVVSRKRATGVEYPARVRGDRPRGSARRRGLVQLAGFCGFRASVRRPSRSLRHRRRGRLARRGHESQDHYAGRLVYGAPCR